MNTDAFKVVAQKTLGRSGLLAKKHSPVILSTVGVVAVVASAVMVGKATLKLEGTIDDAKQYVELSKMQKNEGAIDEKTHTRELGLIYFNAGFKVAKLYAPAVTLGVAGIGCLLGAQGILQKRNVALAAAYKTLENGFTEYRKRVTEELGPEKEKELYRARLLKERDVVNSETGEVTKEKSFDPAMPSHYARFFDEFSTEWQRQAEFNHIFLNNIQRVANDKLRSRGHLFLNEVYDMLGLPRTKEGAVVGWVLEANGDGDNFVDFGMYELGSDEWAERRRAFVNGSEHSILLDFNVDGSILDKI